MPAYLRSLPDRWHLRTRPLRRVMGCGRGKLQCMIRDLETAGHLVRRRSHRAEGRWWCSLVTVTAPWRWMGLEPP